MAKVISNFNKFYLLLSKSLTKFRELFNKQERGEEQRLDSGIYTFFKLLFILTHIFC